MNPRPQATEFSPYFENYVKLVPDGNILDTLEDQRHAFRNFFSAVSSADSNRVHPPYAWTIKQVVGHMIDTEKIFGYRAHRIASRDVTPLPGFDQDEMVRHSDYEDADLQKLVEEFGAVRKANLMFLQRIAPDRWQQRGICDDQEITVRAIAFVLAGHVDHHLGIVRKRLS
jgi:hypothetical protein